MFIRISIIINYMSFNDRKYYFCLIHTHPDFLTTGFL